MQCAGWWTSCGTGWCGSSCPTPVPNPPHALGTGLPWDVPVDDAVAAIAAARARHGDTFAVESGRDHYLFTFSPTGVESFYALTEETASKAVADYLMLRRKLPDEIFAGRRILPNALFRRDDVASYLTNLDRALEHTAAELGPAGSADVFDLMRRLGHRMGLASWARARIGRRCGLRASGARLDTLDGSEAFVHPDRMAAVAATDKRAERAALDEVADTIAGAVARLDDGETGDHALFGRIVDAWSSEAERCSATRDRARRRADPHRVHVEPGGRAGLGVGRPRRAPRAARAGSVRWRGLR